MWTGLVLVRTTKDRSAQVWQAFACGEHGIGLVARRRLRPGDAGVLARWRDHAQGCDPDPSGHAASDAADPPRPLAEGPVAYEVIERARRWSASHLDE